MSCIFGQTLKLCIFFGFILSSAAAHAQSANLMIVDFISAERTNQIDQFIEFLGDKSKEGQYAVIDPRGGTLFADGLNSKKRLKTTALKNLLRTVSVRQRGSSGLQFDLPKTSQMISDTIDAFRKIKTWNVYFLGSISHSDSEYAFSGGYPNDGFLFLKDSEFGFVDRVNTDGATDVKVHVFYSGDQEFESEYDRFIALWSKETWGADLISFNNGLDIGTRPSYKLAALDRETTSSKIVQRGERPNCETFDAHSVSELAYARLDFTITNPCRRGSMVVLRNGEREFSAVADGQGRVKLEVALNEGLNEIEIRQPEGDVWKIIHTHDLGPVQDSIDTEVSDGKVKITGYHPLRENGSLVTIMNDATGRQWRVPVTQQGWVLDEVPLAAGINEFWVVQPDDEGTRIPVIVQNENVCSHSRRVSEKRGLAVIKFTDLCLAGRSLDIKYLGDTYTVNFDAAGRGELKVSLLQSVNRMTYDLRGGERLIEIPVSGFAALIRITLSWDAGVDLDLHIDEPEGPVVFFQNKQGRFGLLDNDVRGTTTGRKQESYVVEASALTRGDTLKISTEYWSRRSQPTAPEFCGEGNLAQLPFEILIIQRGVPTKIQSEFVPVACGTDQTSMISASKKLIKEITVN